MQKKSYGTLCKGAIFLANLVHELDVLKFVYKFIKIICQNILIFTIYLLRKFIIYSTRFASEYSWVALMRCSKI